MSREMAQVFRDAGMGAAPPAAAAGAGRKVPTFDSLDPGEWKTWKERFLTIVAIAGWNDLRSRRELFASMGGPAAKIVADIMLEDPAGGPPLGVPARTLQRVMQEYEGRFVTTEASDQAKAEFTTAQQLTDESLLEWHSRLRDLYLRAYPTAEVDQDPGGQMLRDRFTSGLDNRDIKTYVYDHRPISYRACLQEAQRKQATLMLMNDDKKKGGRTGASGSTVAAMTPKEDIQCYFCHENGHMARDCPKVGRIKGLLQGSERGKKNSRGGRGRGRSTRGSVSQPGNKKKFIASVDEGNGEEKETPMDLVVQAKPDSTSGN